MVTRIQIRSVQIINFLYFLLISEISTCHSRGDKNKFRTDTSSARRGSAIKNMLGENINFNADDNSGTCEGFDSKNGQASGPNDLQCDFESSCCWKNTKPPSDTMEFVKANGEPDTNKFQANFATFQKPTGNYLVVASDRSTSATDKAIYQSCSLCAVDDITVSLRHWQTRGVQIQVCEISPYDHDTLIGCVNQPEVGPGPDSVKLPANLPGQTIQIAIVATNFVSSDGGAAIIDDISVKYTPCNTASSPLPLPPPIPFPTVAPSPASAPPVVQPAGPTSNTAECEKIKCNFNAGNMCYYNAGPVPTAAVKTFENYHGRIGNLATGIPESPDNSNYAGVYLKPKESAYMEVLSNFDIDRVIKFLEYKATEFMLLRVCCDRSDVCAYDTGANVLKTDYRQWYRGAIVCPKGTQKLIFFAQNTGTNQGGVALDNIQPYQHDGGDPNSASVPLC